MGTRSITPHTPDELFYCRHCDTQKKMKVSGFIQDGDIYEDAHCLSCGKIQNGQTLNESIASFGGAILLVGSICLVAYFVFPFIY
jgi:hypothetical protein